MGTQIVGASLSTRVGTIGSHYELEYLGLVEVPTCTRGGRREAGGGRGEGIGTLLVPTLGSEERVSNS
jgi:hypothetical protein